MNFQKTLETAESIARQAGAIIREYYHRSVQVDFKSELDLVTDADRAVETYLLDALREAFPEIGIVGEEGGAYAPENASYAWYIDPIDGTTNFAHRMPHCAVSLGLADTNMNPALGVVYNPIHDDCFAGYTGGGASLNGKPIHVSDTSMLNRAMFTTGFPYDRNTAEENNKREWMAMLLHTQAVRCLGSAALDLAYVAAGWMDGYWEQKLNRWDCFAGIVLVREAGGIVTDYAGGDAGLHLSQVQLVATNGHIQGETLRVIQDVREMV